MDQALGYYVRITAADGSVLRWHKNGVLHRLSPQLGPTWLAHFNTAIWEVTPEGAFVPPGSGLPAQAIRAVALEPVHESAAD